MLGPVPQHLYVSDYKVYKTLCALKTEKSPGPDGIPIVVWKEFAFELSPALADIYNSSLEQGYFPTQLKQAIVVPVPKLRPPKSVENDLRPISQTSPIAKVLSNLLFLVARQLRLLSSLYTLFWKHWTLVADWQMHQNFLLRL